MPAPVIHQSRPSETLTQPGLSRLICVRHCISSGVGFGRAGLADARWVLAALISTAGHLLLSQFGPCVSRSESRFGRSRIDATRFARLASITQLATSANPASSRVATQPLGPYLRRCLHPHCSSSFNPLFNVAYGIVVEGLSGLLDRFTSADARAGAARFGRSYFSSLRARAFRPFWRG